MVSSQQLTVKFCIEVDRWRFTGGEFQQCLFIHWKQNLNNDNLFFDQNYKPVTFLSYNAIAYK